MQTTRVMIVDDHVIVIEALTRLVKTDQRLAVSGCARTLAEARLLLARLTPDVILLDLRLPDSEGCATISAVRACCGPARIVVLTGSPGVTAEQAQRSGADAYLDKQTESARIVETILDVVDLELGAGVPHEALSSRELEVARLAAEGLSNAEIARGLYISENTVKTHLARILAKLRLRNRTDLASHWHRR